MQNQSKTKKGLVTLKEDKKRCRELQDKGWCNIGEGWTGTDIGPQNKEFEDSEKRILTKNSQHHSDGIFDVLGNSPLTLFFASVDHYFLECFQKLSCFMFPTQHSWRGGVKLGFSTAISRYIDVHLTSIQIGQILHESTCHRNWEGEFFWSSFSHWFLWSPLSLW